MLSFRVTESGTEVQIYCDAVGMATLMDALITLVGGTESHIHLRRSNGLNEETPWGEDAAKEVMINYNKGLD